MAISTTSFISDMILFLRNSLRTNITDPIGRTGSGTQFIFTAYPKEGVAYPLITIKNTNINTTPMGMQSEVQYCSVDLEFRVWARNSKECDNLSQQLINHLRGIKYGTSSTTENAIYGFKLNSAVPVVEENGDLSVHSKVLGFTYKCILED